MSAMTSDFYDVIVVGAGINGVGVAQASAAAGYKTLILEKNPQPGLETSARSSKLIHGGLRYLESRQFRLVRESLQERALLLKLAPDLVRLKNFIIPVYQHSRRQAKTLHLGLSLYRLFGGGRYHNLSISDWDNPDQLDTRNLDSLFQYQDAQTDDQALTRSVLQSAIELGADYQFQSTVDHIALHRHGVQLNYQQHGKDHSLKSRVVVNATGPWVTRLNQRVSPAIHFPDPELIQGTHLVIDSPVSQAYYLESISDNRVVFALPWKGKTLLGTTEHRFQGDPSQLSALDMERDYLLNIYHHYFPNSRPDVLSEFTGARVLPGSNQSAFDRPRETLLLSDSNYPHYISIVGGKLTVYRKTALKIMQQVSAQLPARQPIADTALLPLKVAESL